MIRSRKTTKNCNICTREVAVRKIIRFETTCGFVTLRGDERSLVSLTHRDDVHICNYCWERMSNYVRDALKKDGRC